MIKKDDVAASSFFMDDAAAIPSVSAVALEFLAISMKKHLPKARMELLPYHKFGFGKYEALGYPLPSEDFSAPDAEKMRRLNEIIRKTGIVLADFK